MAVTFLEPGGDADFLIGTTNGFWGGPSSSGVIATDFVHGSHKKSISFPANSSNVNYTINNIISDSGGRISFYIYLVALPNSNTSIAVLLSTNSSCLSIALSSAGVLFFTQGGLGTGTQVGSNGTIPLSTGIWYRISLAYTITSTVVNRFELFVNGSSCLSVTNGTLAFINTTRFLFGNNAGNLTMNTRFSDIYADNSNSLTDTGDIWVTAKRPNANGTTNGFTTPIGAGGSGYGTGHSPQVNERPLSTTNGWSMVGAGSAVTEEYNIESKSTGDIIIQNYYNIVDYIGWASMSSLVGETVQMIVNGTNFSQAITSTITMYTKVAGSTTYPTGTGADIGIITDTSLTTVSLYECGILVAYIPTLAPSPVAWLTA